MKVMVPETTAVNWLTAAARDLQTRPRGNVPVLDLLRTLAILFVFFAHVVGSFRVPAIVAKLPIFYFGWTGVDLFFVLSGFLIGGQLWKELKRTGAINVPRFILRRGFRIWPLYFSLVLTLIVCALVLHRPTSGFLADLFCVSNYFHHRVGGGWSLSTEEQFYVVCPAILFLGIRLLPPQRLIAIPVAWFAALPLLRWSITRGESLAAAQQAIYTPFHTHSDGLAVGLILAWVAIMRPDKMKAGFRSNAILLLCVVLASAFLRAIGQAVFAYTSLALVFGSCMLVLLRTERPPAWMNWHGFYILSRLSYGIYLNHFGILEHLDGAVKSAFGDGLAGCLVASAAGLVATIVVAFLTFAVIELPFLRLRDRWLSRGGTALRARASAAAS